MRFRNIRALVCLFVLIAAFGAARAAGNPFLGGWELTIPGGAAGWLSVEDVNGQLRAGSHNGAALLMQKYWKEENNRPLRTSLLWGGGSVTPLDSARIEMGKLILTRKHTSQRKNESGKTVKAISIETITATVDGDVMKLSTVKPRDNGQGEDKSEFTRRREPPMPPAPDLAQVKFGEPVRLLNGKDLTGWRLTSPGALSGWSVKDGVLVNEVSQEEGKPHKNYGNLRTDQVFEDFNLTLEVRVAKDGNSGVYLRGIYEVQVTDSYGKPLDPHHMGAIYSRIKPTVSAEKPAGEWQTLDITLVARHVTVVLNGQRIIDNQPLLGCTGGALWSDVTRPGPIYLQGDHTGIEYRNLILKPVRE